MKSESRQDMTVDCAVKMSVTSGTNRIPVSWEDMAIHEQIGAGSYAPVFRVTLNESTYALKRILIPPHPEEAQALSHRLGSKEKAKVYFREVAEEMLEETKILRKLRGHQNIVAIEDYRLLETVSGYELSILMEYLESFPQYEITHALSEETVIRLGLDLCQALEACEKENILHRDLKPDNILVTPEGTFKAGDFGLAKSLEKSLPKGSVKGTFSFMAPEVYHGKAYDRRADLYSLGMILYQAMNRGKDPFISPEQRMIHPKDREKALERRMNGEALPPPADASDDFSEILLKSCAFYPEKRYASAADLKKDLLCLQNGTYKRKKRRVGPYNRYGKRTRRDYIKSGILGFFALIIVLAAGNIAWYEYQEHIADYCDKTIQKALEEEYNIPNQARLNGHGVLTIPRNSDLYCTIDGEAYPWMNQKDRIKKIVFEENVTGISPFLEASPEGGTLRNAISEYSFRNCQNLEKIVIKGSSFEISGVDLFLGDNNLEIIECSKETDVEIEDLPFEDTLWISEDGYRMIGTALIRYNGTDEVLKDIPENTVWIAPNAFFHNDDVREVILPEKVRVIGDAAFRGCRQLENIQFPDSITQIGYQAFADCPALTDIQIPGSVSLIGDNAFNGCKSLDHLTIYPENTFYTMEDGALYTADRSVLLWCSPSVSGTFVIPDTVTHLSEKLFQDCPTLTGVVFPEGIVWMPNELFGKCPVLTEITLPETITFCNMQNDILYYENQTQLMLCLRNKTGNLTIPDGVIVILAYAFSSCKDLTRVTVPDTVSFIMDHAFEDCTGLRSIKLPGTLRMLASHTFSGCTDLTDIYYAGTREDWEELTGRFDLGIDETQTAIHFGEEE